MARSLRVDYEGAFYVPTARGNERAYLFGPQKSKVFRNVSICMYI